MSREKGNSKRNVQPKKRRRGWAATIREGSWLTLEYFKRYAWIFAAIIIAFISLIGLRFKTKTKISEIENLQQEYKLAESHKLNEKAKYMSLIRESEMLKIIEENHLSLTFREQPPYVISNTDSSITTPSNNQ